MQVEETVKVKRKIYVAPCLKCKCDDIQLYDCGYSSFNYGGGKCNKCKHEVSTQVDMNPTMRELAEIWNAENDKTVLISDAKKRIEKDLALIKELEE